LPPAAPEEIAGEPGEQFKRSAKILWSLAEDDFIATAEDLHLVRIEMKLPRNSHSL